MKRVNTNQKLMIVLVVVLSLMALHTFSKESDELPELNAKQRREIVSSWHRF